jgi:hypothetical protein
MPERLRRHAAGSLRASRDEHYFRTRHAEVVITTIRRLLVESRGRFDRAMDELGELLDEILHALAWTCENDREAYRRLLAFASYPLYWFGRNAPFLDDAVAFARAGEPVDLAQGHLWLSAAWDVTGVDLDHEERCRYIEASRQCFEVHGEPDDRAWVTSTKILLLMEEGDVDGARAELDEAIEDARAAGLKDWVDELSDQHALVDLRAGDIVGAERQLLDIEAAQRSNYMATGATNLLADCALLQGQFTLSLRRFTEELQRRQRKDALNAVYDVAGLAMSCLGLGRDDAAVELLGLAASAYRTRSGGRALTDLDLTLYSSQLQTAAERLGEDLLVVADRTPASITDEVMRERALAIAAEVAG